LPVKHIFGLIHAWPPQVPTPESRIHNPGFGIRYPAQSRGICGRACQDGKPKIDTQILQCKPTHRHFHTSISHLTWHVSQLMKIKFLYRNKPAYEIFVCSHDSTNALQWWIFVWNGGGRQKRGLLDSLVECQRYSIYPNPRISIIFRSHIRKQKVCSGKISHGYWIEIF